MVTRVRKRLWAVGANRRDSVRYGEQARNLRRPLREQAALIPASDASECRQVMPPMHLIGSMMLLQKVPKLIIVKIYKLS